MLLGNSKYLLKDEPQMLRMIDQMTNEMNAKIAANKGMMLTMQIMKN